MNSDFIVKIRFSVQNLPPSENKIIEIENSFLKLIDRIKNVHEKQPEMAKRYLFANKQEVLKEIEYSKAKINHFKSNQLDKKSKEVLRAFRIVDFLENAIKRFDEFDFN